MVSQDNPSSEPRRARGRPRDWSDKTAQNTIKSLDRAMEVFEFLSEHQGKALTTLATETDQSPATVYRILVTLEGRGLVEFDAVEQLWHIGPRAFVIGARFLRRTSLVERARPVMRRLMEQTGETANLGIERGGQVLFVSQVETEATIRAFFPRHPVAHARLGHRQGAAGGNGRRAVAARFGGQDAHRLHPAQHHPPGRPARRSGTGPRAWLCGGRRRTQHRNALHRSPVFDIHQEAVAGISVSGPTSRVGLEDIERLSVAVRAAAADLSATLGVGLESEINKLQCSTKGATTHISY